MSKQKYGNIGLWSDAAQEKKVEIIVDILMILFLVGLVVLTIVALSAPQHTKDTYHICLNNHCVQLVIEEVE